MTGPADDITRVAQGVARLCANIGLVIQGKPEVIRNAVICLLAEGHLLLEDVPRHRQDVAGAGARVLAVDHLEPHPVHP